MEDFGYGVRWVIVRKPEATEYRIIPDGKPNRLRKGKLKLIIDDRVAHRDGGLRVQ